MKLNTTYSDTASTATQWHIARMNNYNRISSPCRDPGRQNRTEQNKTKAHLSRPIFNIILVIILLIFMFRLKVRHLVAELVLYFIWFYLILFSISSLFFFSTPTFPALRWFPLPPLASPPLPLPILLSLCRPSLSKSARHLFLIRTDSRRLISIRSAAAL